MPLLFAHRERMVKGEPKPWKEIVRQSGRDTSTGLRYHSAMKLRIREIREAKGLTVTELASAIGVGKSFMSEMERGIKQINGQRLDAVSRVLGCAPYELIDDQSVSPDILNHIKTLQELSTADRSAVIRHAESLAGQSETDA